MRLEKLAKEVKSGDITNCEALAAQYYWKALFGKDFVRNQNADDS
jgi:CRISPR-associated protein Cas1